MSGKIVFRLLLVLALIGTAHWLKPFSVKNITQHLLYSTRSFAFFLPEQARARFSQASDLALNLSDNLFENAWRANSDEGGDEGGDEGLILAAQARPDSLRPALKIWPPDEAGRPGRKSKPAPKRSAPAKRIERADRNEVAAVIASETPWNAAASEVSEEEPAADEEAEALPAVLPVIYPAPSLEAARSFSIGFLFTTEGGEKTSCSEPEFKLLKSGAGIEVLKRPRILLLRAEKPRSVAPECEGEKPDSGPPKPDEMEVAAPAEEAPEPAEPREPEIHPGTERPSPLKCPAQPEN